MFERRKTRIGGLDLPEDFDVVSLVNNIAISKDGRYAAVTKDKNLVLGNIPSNGRIEVDGTIINYRRGGSISVSNQGSSINIGGMSSIVMSGGNISIGGSSLDYEIDEDYNVSTGDEIALISKNEGIELALNESNTVRVKGLTASEPKYSNGRLFINELQGKLWLPRDVSSGLEVSLETKNGSISGELSHPGFVESKNGSIILSLYAPLVVNASTKNGSVNVVGMTSEGGGRYVPANKSTIGKLRASTKNGNVQINYIRN